MQASIGNNNFGDTVSIDCAIRPIFNFKAV